MFFPKPNDGSILSIMSGLVGLQKPKPVPTVQRDISDIFSDLEAGDRLRDEREAVRGTKDRRNTKDRRAAIDLKQSLVERRRTIDRRF